MKNLFDNREFAAGASASLNKTITAMMNFLEDDGNRPSRHFRTFLYKKIADSNEYWFRRVRMCEGQVLQYDKERYLCKTCLTPLTLVAHLAGQASRCLTLGLLHALEMRCGYCISANFVESSSSVHINFGE